MALINFPSSPVVNQVYKHEEGTSLEKAFIFKAGEIGASDGYWSGFPTTGFGPASATEINAGTEQIKYIAPDQLELSKYYSTDDIAPQGDVDSGTGDKVVVPSKLRFGFSFSTGTTGYIIFPSWLGGFIIQWGTASFVSTIVTVTLPVTFPTQVMSATCSYIGTAVNGSGTRVNIISNSQISVSADSSNRSLSWMVFGY